MRLSPLALRAAAVGVLALTLGCARDRAGAAGGSASAAADGGATTKTIGVTLLTREHDFYRTLEAGMRDEAAAKGYKLLVTSGDFDLAKQQSQIDNFLVQHVDAIVVCPVDSKGIAPAIEKANAANVPVFTADIAAQGGKVVAHVASDNVSGGKLAADFIAKSLGGTGEVAIVGQPGIQSTIDREQGFRDALRAYPNLKLVATLDGGGVRDRALKAADDLFQAHPNVAGVFAINDESALGVLSSAQSHHADKLVLVGYDASPEARKAILTGGQLKADVAQDPKALGVRTVDAIAAHFAGQATPAAVAVPVTVLDAAALRAAGPR